MSSTPAAIPPGVGDAVTVVIVLHGREDLATFRPAKVVPLGAMFGDSKGNLEVVFDVTTDGRDVFQFRADGVGGIVRIDSEGIKWMRGHGPEVEAALRAAWTLHDGGAQTLTDVRQYNRVLTAEEIEALCK